MCGSRSIRASGEEGGASERRRLEGVRRQAVLPLASRGVGGRHNSTGGCQPSKGAPIAKVGVSS